ncbi:SCP-like protein [Teladorsagia circumcincta]|uniref:SCP-like protein n=1 Tax=Teladorsagia circumcincta TaxID=45464 RepID=A0A2G9UVA9_TELCI|nr:SCP-like protein [Teladorsagia circumcincta]
MLLFLAHFRSRLAQGLVPNYLTHKNAPPGSNINNLTYSRKLEHAAQKIADTCRFPAQPSDVGQNFAMVSSSLASTSIQAIVHAVQLWWREIKRIGIRGDMLFTQDLSNSPSAPRNFTQMAWASITQVGCGIERCENGYFVVCHYNPR